MISTVDLIAQLQREMRAWDKHQRYLRSMAKKFHQQAEERTDPSGVDLYRRIALSYDCAAQSQTEPMRIRMAAFNLVNGEAHLLPEELRMP